MKYILKRMSLAVTFCILSLTPSFGEGERETIIRVRYAFKQVSDAGYEKCDTMSLDIGRTCSAFYDATIERKRAERTLVQQTIKSILVTKEDLTSRLMRSTSGERMIYNDDVTVSVFKDKIRGKILSTDVQGQFMMMFTEPLEPLVWSLQSDEMTFLGYVCQKAASSFRGRNYIAYYSSDIPVLEGPWKFTGLPGLILKVASEDGQIAFEAISIEWVKDVSVEIPDENKYEQCKNLKQFYDFQESMSHNKSVTFINGKGEATMYRDNSAIAPVPIETKY